MPNYSPFLPLLAALAAAPLVACSSAETGGTGGSAGTSTSTATGSGGATPAARVIVRDHAGRPAVGVDVLVHDTTGKTTQQLKTDATGAATVELVEGGGVTALYATAQESGTRYNAVSVVGLAEGAEVRLVADPDAGNDAPLPMTLAFTGVPPLQSADWDIVVSCNADLGTSETSLLYSGCPGSSTYDLVAFLSGGDKRIVFPAQPVQAGKSVPFQLDPAKAEAAAQVEVDVEGAPAGTLALQAHLWANRPEGGRTQLFIFQNPSKDGSLLKIPRLPVSAGGTFDLDVVAVTTEGGLIETFPFTADKLPTSALAWKPLAVPYASSTTITGTAQRPEVAWTIPPGAMPADAVRINLDYIVGQRPVDWTLYMASSVGATAKFPEIPASFSGWTPESGSATIVATHHIDVAGTASLLAAVNAEFDRTGSAWSSTTLNATTP